MDHLTETPFFPFQDISSMKNVISRVKGNQPAPILLVANKLDLERQREVSTTEGESFIFRKLVHFLFILWFEEDNFTVQ